MVSADTPAILTPDAHRRAEHPAASACINAHRCPPTRSTSSRERDQGRHKNVEHGGGRWGAGVVPTGTSLRHHHKIDHEVRQHHEYRTRTSAAIVINHWARARRCREDVEHGGGRWRAWVLPADKPAMVPGTAHRHDGHPPVTSTCSETLRHLPTSTNPFNVLAGARSMLRRRY